MNSNLTASGILLCLTLFFFSSLVGQNLRSNSELSKEEKDRLIQLADELFDKVPPISFNISSYDLKPDISYIPNPTQYDESYLDSLLSELDNSNSNPAIYMSIAGYYDKTNQTALANSNYQKAYENLNEKLFQDDVAAYYSLRALLKNILGKPDALEDLKKSLAINPNDSLAIQIYPNLLMLDNEFNKANKMLSDALEKGSGNMLFPYMQLMSFEFMETGKNITAQEQNGVNVRNKYESANFDEIFDYTLIHKYGKMYENQLEIFWARRLADIMGLFMKMVVLYPKEYNNLNSIYTTYDKEKTENLIAEFSSSSGWEAINDFTLNRCLGYLYFMNGERSQSLTHFDRAIEVFPDTKRDHDFNPMDCYDMIMVIHKLDSDSLDYRKAILRKIDNASDKTKSVDDLTLLAYDYFQSGELKEANKLCNEVMLVDSNHFDTLRLKSHLSFLQGEKQLSQFYLENAGNHLKNPLDEYNLTLQYAIYLIYDGNAEMAEPVLQSLKASRGRRSCPLCDTLIKEYCSS